MVPGTLFDDRLAHAEENLQLLRPLKEALCGHRAGPWRPDALMVSRREWLAVLLEGQAAQLEVIRDLPRRRRRWAAEFGDHGAGQFAALAVSLSQGTAIMLICYRPVDDPPGTDAALCLSRDCSGQRYALWHSGTLEVGDPVDAAAVAHHLVYAEGQTRDCEQAAIAQRDRQLEQIVARYRADGIDVCEGEALLAQMRALTTTEERRQLASALEPVYEEHLALGQQAATIRDAVNCGVGAQRARRPPSPASLMR
jgi:hypothetical protein